MARKRLDDTGALVARGFETTVQSSHVSKSVRRIDNGYVTEVCTSGPGGYKRSETFSQTPPDSDGRGAAHGPNETRGSLADAVGYLKGGK